MVHACSKLMFVMVVTGTVFASGASADPSQKFKPIVDLRYRVESVSRDDFDENALAHTFRARLGAQFDLSEKVSLLFEGEAIANLNDQFNSTTNGETQFPVVADPEGTELNRAQIQITPTPQTKLTVGRQRLAFQNQRFLGDVGWRQNQQTFDAVSIDTALDERFSVRYAYIDRVHRIFGDDHPNGELDSDSHAAELTFKSAKYGSFTGYSFSLDFDNAPGASTTTWGIRAKNSLPIGPAEGLSFAYTAEYAEQKDNAGNPTDFALGYRHGELALNTDTFGVSLGAEVLEGDGVVGFSTPLATLHKFQGHADIFLATPANGVRDMYASGKYISPVKPFGHPIGVAASYHRFDADRGDSHFGYEVDMRAWTRLTDDINALVKAAFFRGEDGGPADRTVIWASVQYNLKR